MSRFDYVAYDHEAARQQAACKQSAQQLEASINALDDGRAKSLALTKLEEVYMWVGKAIRDQQMVRNGGADLQEGRCNS